MSRKLFLENYNIKLTYMPGKNDVLTDIVLRLPRTSGPVQGKNKKKGKLVNLQPIQVPIDKDDVFMHADAILLPQLLPTQCQNKDTDILELFMNLLLLQEISCSVTTQSMQTHQARDT